MATTSFTATTGDDSWTLKKGSKLTTLDGLEGSDTLSFGKVKLGVVSITESTDNMIKVDTVSGASATYHLQLENIETLKFENGKTSIDLSTYFTVASGTPSSGSDTLKGVSDADAIAGAAGNDSITGLGGNDTLAGDAGADTITGGNGADTISGGEGKDKLSGDDGADIFVFDSLKSGEYDSITDFTDDDFLTFDTTVFTQLTGASAANLINGAKALDADDYLIYNAGKLYYDADGSGSGSAIQIAGIKGSDYKTLTIDDMQFV